MFKYTRPEDEPMHGRVFNSLLKIILTPLLILFLLIMLILMIIIPIGFIWGI